MCVYGLCPLCRHSLQEYFVVHDLVLSSCSLPCCLTPLLQFSFCNNILGQIVYRSWTLSLYSIVFAILSLFVISIFNQFVSAYIFNCSLWPVHCPLLFFSSLLGATHCSCLQLFYVHYALSASLLLLLLAFLSSFINS